MDPLPPAPPPPRPPAREAAPAAPPGSPAPDAPPPAGPRPIARIIGANLRHLRKERFPEWGGQRKFAAFLGLTANDLSVYECGRIAPNERRQSDMARRLGLSPEQLRAPLPGVAVPPPAPARTSAEAAWQERVEGLRRENARLEGRLEAIQEELARERGRAARLQEAHIALLHLLYGDDSPEARSRRERVMARLAPTLAEIARLAEES